jgi:hypothetical protein
MVPVSAPATVESAYRLWRAAAAVSVSASLLSVLIVDDLQAVRGTPLPPGPDTASTLLAGAVIGALLTVLVSAIVLALAARMRAGTSWARTVLAVLGAGVVAVGLLTLGGTLALFGAGALGALVGLLSLANIVLVALAVSAMFRPPAGAYFG